MRQLNIMLRIFTGLLFSVSLLLPVSSLARGSSDAHRLIVGINDNLLSELQSKHDAIKQDQAVAYGIAARIVVPHIDFDRIGRIVLGKYWRRASADQKKRFLREFRFLLTHTYVTAMVTYLDQIIDRKDDVSYLPLRARADATDVTVRSEINLRNARKVPVNYSLRLTKGKWKIDDVSIDGISLATNYRSSFGSQVRRDGLNALIERMQKKNDRYPHHSLVSSLSK